MLPGIINQLGEPPKAVHYSAALPAGSAQAPGFSAAHALCSAEHRFQAFPVADFSLWAVSLLPSEICREIALSWFHGLCVCDRLVLRTCRTRQLDQPEEACRAVHSRGRGWGPRHDAENH